MTHRQDHPRSDGHHQAGAVRGNRRRSGRREGGNDQGRRRSSLREFQPRPRPVWLTEGIFPARRLRGYGAGWSTPAPRGRKRKGTGRRMNSAWNFPRGRDFPPRGDAWQRRAGRVLREHSLERGHERGFPGASFAEREDGEADREKDEPGELADSLRKWPILMFRAWFGSHTPGSLTMCWRVAGVSRNFPHPVERSLSCP